MLTQNVETIRWIVVVIEMVRFELSFEETAPKPPSL